jgi:hypothetical protein
MLHSEANRYKDKLRAVLSQGGRFVCPRHGAVVPAPSDSKPAHVDAPDAQIEVVLADLARRGAAKPKNEQTLRNTIAAAFQQKLAEEELSALLARLQAREYVSISDGKVDYTLPGGDV